MIREADSSVDRTWECCPRVRAEVMAGMAETVMGPMKEQGILKMVMAMS